MCRAGRSRFTFASSRRDAALKRFNWKQQAGSKNCLAFYKIIAWRVMQLTYLNRECPSLSCTAVFDDCEWKSVWRVTTKQELPKNPPALSEFIPLLAQLGGYNNRPSEPPPGPQAIWVGIRRMTDFAVAWVTFGPNVE